MESLDSRALSAVLLVINEDSAPTSRDSIAKLFGLEREQVEVFSLPTIPKHTDLNRLTAKIREFHNRKWLWERLLWLVSCRTTPLLGEADRCVVVSLDILDKLGTRTLILSEIARATSNLKFRYHIFFLWGLPPDIPAEKIVKAGFSGIISPVVFEDGVELYYMPAVATLERGALITRRAASIGLMGSALAFFPLTWIGDEIRSTYDSDWKIGLVQVNQAPSQTSSPYVLRIYNSGFMPKKDFRLSVEGETSGAMIHAEECVHDDIPAGGYRDVTVTLVGKQQPKAAHPLTLVVNWTTGSPKRVVLQAPALKVVQNSAGKSP